ncbi:3'-5' exonuclease, partial [Gluconobacter cerinus]
REFDGARLFKLEKNFRSTHHILQAANAIIARDPGRIPKTLFTQKGDGQKIEVLSYDYASDEADAIAAEMGRRAAEGVAWH